jgi:ubiquinone biosynthesis protein
VGLAARVGASYGRSLVARSLGLGGDDARALAHQRNAARILETAVALRGPFMKLVQLLAVQGEMLPDEYLEALSTLHDKAPPLPWADVRPVLEAELGRPPERVFGSIDPRPIAAASLGQVYAGRLPDGTPVAVKVQYPGVREAVETDLRALRRLMRTQKRLGADLLGLAGFDHEDTFADLAGRLREELDYRHEAANAETFRRIYRQWEWVTVPRVHREFSTGRVLTMDLLGGVPLRDMLRSDRPVAERERLALRFAEMLDHEYYGVGVFHADPHPGNKLVGPGGQIQLLDFGCVKVLPRRARDAFRASARALLAGDDAANLAALRDLGMYRDGLDPEPLLAWSRLANRPLLVDGPYDATGFDYRTELFARFADLTRHGYVHFAPHTLFLLRCFIGLVAMFRMLGVTTIDYRRRTIDFLATHLAEGDRLRAELEEEGLVTAGG